jgi:hypothetical protein
MQTAIIVELARINTVFEPVDQIQDNVPPVAIKDALAGLVGLFEGLVDHDPPARHTSRAQYAYLVLWKHQAVI